MPIAHFLTTRVFCILGDFSDDGPRVTAQEFGVWARDLPAHFLALGHARAVPISSTLGHPLATGLPPSKPASRQASVNNGVARRGSTSASRPPPFSHGYSEIELPTVLDDDNEGEVHEGLPEEKIQPKSRTSSIVKRFQRAARKDKGKDVQTERVYPLESIAEASQTLAREISRSYKVSGSGYVFGPVPNVTKSNWKLVIGGSNGDRSPTLSTPSFTSEVSSIARSYASFR
jgi:hypothetical protein